MEAWRTAVLGPIFLLLGAFLVLRALVRKGHAAGLRRQRREGARFGLFVRRVDRERIERAAFFCCAAGATLSVLGESSWPVWVLAVILVPGTSAVFVSVDERRRRSFETAAGALLRAVRGLLAAGFSLPTALEMCAQRLPGEAAATLRLRLDRLHEGAPLLRCLGRFHARVRAPALRAAFEGLAVAYRDGLPLLPLFDRVLPWVDRERDVEGLLRELRAKTALQLVFAALVPWALLAFLAQADGDLVERFVESGEAFVLWPLAAALQLGGGWLAWHVSSYR